MFTSLSWSAVGFVGSGIDDVEAYTQLIPEASSLLLALVGLLGGMGRPLRVIAMREYCNEVWGASVCVSLLASIRNSQHIRATALASGQTH